MEKYSVPITWTMNGRVIIEATSAEEAYDKVYDDFDYDKFDPCNGEYLEDSLDGNGEEYVYTKDEYQHIYG